MVASSSLMAASAGPFLRSLGSVANPPCRRKQFSVRVSGDGKTVSSKEKGGWRIDCSAEKPATPLLDTINFPIHMKNLSSKDLEQLSAELRSEIMYMVSKSGGHLGASLGVVELAVALHHVFNAPQDKIIWDVGHQAYPHKILTGRRSRMHTIRQTSGLAGSPQLSLATASAVSS